MTTLSTRRLGWLHISVVLAILTGMSGCGGGGKGTLFVQGTGDDLYEVFDASGRNKVNFKSTNSEMELTAGRYVLFLNGAGAKVQIRSGRKLTVKLASVRIEGLGQDLYEVYGPKGERKLQFKSTNKTIELLAGRYIIRLNGWGQQVMLAEGQAYVVKAGSLHVKDTKPVLYSVYDEPGGNKLDFRSTGKTMELLPRTYSVECAGKTHSVEIKSGEQVEIEP